MRFLVGSVLAVSLAACGTAATQPDGGFDAGRRDDAGTPSDAGRPDAGTPDAGSDAGYIPCGPDNCTGCCNGTCFTFANQRDVACGTGGALCMGCGAGQSCLNGSCSCNPTSCPNGCCVDNACTSSNHAHCGTDAGACVACAMGTTCTTAGTCDPTPDGGPCDLNSCEGCCDSNNVCQLGTSVAVCGINAYNCLACTSACINGNCGCSGCFDSTLHCHPGTESTACGVGNTLCKVCDAGMGCGDAGECF